MYKIAAAYRHMALSVQQAPVPSELAAQQLEQYRAEVKKTIVDPFNEKALTYSVQCLDKSQEFNLLSPWTAKCRSMAGALQPKRYPTVRTFYLPPLNTALINPKKKDAVIKRGHIRKYALPLFSSALFNEKSTQRALASTSSTLPLLNTGVQDFNSPVDISPMITTYQPLRQNRQKALVKDTRGEKPDRKEKPSFAYLNLKRLVSPQTSVQMILDAIERDPKDISLHNLLALAYLELDQLPAAKVTWLALTARGHKNAAIWNNLGVVYALEGNEDAAIEYFHQATLMEKPKESLVNLGFVALKYHNGFEAKKHFKRALERKRKDPTVQIGLAVARLQNREIENVMERLPELSKRHRSNPYARLSLAYFLMDIAKERRIAHSVLQEYMDKHSAENNPQFRKALSEAKQMGPTAELDGDLPVIDP